MDSDQDNPAVPTKHDIERLDKQYSYHMPVKQIAHLAKSHYIFTIVRNPLARLYSCYSDKIVSHKEKGIPSPLAYWGLHNDISFENFVRQIAEIPDIESNTHFRSIHPFLTYKGNLIPHTICKLENLENDWLTVQKNILNFPSLPKINQTNITGKPLYINAYNRELAEITYERFQTDIELLGYEKEIKRMIAAL